MITTQATTYGTSHFVSINAAIRYYEPYSDNPRSSVALKLAGGEIFIGRPLLRHGQTLAVINGRYHVTEGGR